MPETDSPGRLRERVVATSAQHGPLVAEMVPVRDPTTKIALCRSLPLGRTIAREMSSEIFSSAFTPSVVKHHTTAQHPANKVAPWRSGGPYQSISPSQALTAHRRQSRRGAGLTDWLWAPLLAQFLAFPGHVLPSILRTCNCTSTPSKRLLLLLPLVSPPPDSVIRSPSSCIRPKNTLFLSDLFFCTSVHHRSNRHSLAAYKVSVHLISGPLASLTPTERADIRYTTATTAPHSKPQHTTAHHSITKAPTARYSASYISHNPFASRT
ncbi:hypothetical protein B0T22DRAFT_187135 [Podospora appendiculata]|uniref:Uncharacterized protein n=1 Tax=Podospora appendiculata TaxID=314037 RepID=A0AAE1CDT8_9PEZI|nr:hypothetical protein B0T22DRAFT_187135 [Podospora appendiculata]